MNNWRELLNNKKGLSDSPSILDKAVTGVEGNSDSPMNLFYSEFSEQDCKTFYDIFEKFKMNFFQNQQNCIVILQNNLFEQIESMPKNVCPIEVLLYASNSIKYQITSNEKLFLMLKKIVSKLLQRYDSNKVVWYILSGWEWLEPISILIEAIGDVNDDNLIKLAMNYYPTLAEYAQSVNNKRLFKSYIAMILNSQNELYTNYLIDIASNKDFNDNELIEYFIKKIGKKNSFTSKDEIWHSIVNELKLSNITRIFKNKLTSEEKRKDKMEAKSDQDCESYFDPNDLSFGKNCSPKIRKCKNCNDTSKYKEICDAIMKSIDCIPPKYLRGEAYIVLGTKGKQFSQIVIPFLKNQMEKYPSYTPQITASLYSLDEASIDDLFYAILDIKDSDGDTFRNIGGFFRYKSRDFSEYFLPFIYNKIIDFPDEETFLFNCAYYLFKVLEVFNGNDNKLAKDVAASNEIVKIIQLYVGNYHDKYIYYPILDIVDIISCCSSQISKLLAYLDLVKDTLPNDNDSSIIVSRINAMIKEYDTIRPGK